MSSLEMRRLLREESGQVVPALERVARRGVRDLAREGGQSLVEFALIVPFVLLLVWGIVDFSSAYSYQNNEMALANEAVRMAAVGNCGSMTASGGACQGGLVTAQTKSDASGNLKNGGGSIVAPGVSVTLCFPPMSGGGQSTGAVGQPIRANVTASYRWLPELATAVGIPNQVTISASATQPMDQAYNPSGADGTVPNC